MTKFSGYFSKILVILVITIVFLELVGFTLLKFDHTELFSIRNFTEKTNDKRFYTVKKNYSDDELDHFYGGKTFLITTSSEGFRISKKDNKAGNYLSDKNLKEKILFLGDSVTFGWGVEAEESLPFLFKKYNNNFSVLNGAIPGYSLAQAIERFKIEFINIKNLKYIYLQVYSPAPSYGRLGTNWTEDDNWANFPEQVLRTHNIPKITIPFYGEPYSYNFFRKKMYRIRHKKMKEISYDQRSDEKYIKHIKSNLNKLYDLTKHTKSTLILSSTNVPKFSANTRSKAHNRSIKILNENLYNFSLEKKDVLYLDLSNELNVDSKKMFLDFCCHLSREGANLMALKLTKLIQNID